MDTFNKDLFRDRLKTLRKDKKLTQAEAAELFGVSRTCYSSWELGQSCPPLNDLFSLCIFFNVSSDFMLGLTNSFSKIKEVPVSIAKTSILRRDSNPLDELDPDLRSKADGYIDSLLEQQKERQKQTQTQEA